MKLVYSKTVNLVSMLALLCMLVLPYLVPATVNATDKDHGLGSENSPALLITKTDSEGNPIAGVKYKIIKTHSYNPAPGVAYEDAFTEVSDGKIIEGITDAKGQIVLEKQEHKGGLELGRYTVKEIKVPAGIVLNSTEFTVNIPTKIEGGNQDGKLDYKIEIYSKAEYVKGAVELTKVDDDQQALAGAQFELYLKGTNGIADTKIGGTYTTNESGKISVDGLDYGDYYFVETKAPEGYVLDTTKVEFTVTKAGSVKCTTPPSTNRECGAVHVSMVNYTAPTIKKDVEGAKHFDVERDKTYTYNLTLNLPTNINKYSEYVVTDTLDSRLTYADNWSVTGVNKDKITFTESVTDGKEVLTWTVNDISALKDVKQIVISFEAKIKPDAVLAQGETGIPNDATLQFNNGLGGYGSQTADEVTVKPTDVAGEEGEKNSLKVIKVDADDNTITLAGAEFKLTTDKKGNKVVDAKDTEIKVNGEQTTGKLEKLTTNENGEILIEGLPAGTYYLHETKAPTYKDKDGEDQSYKMLTSPIEVSISSDKLNEVKVENSKSDWSLPQTGGLGSLLLVVTGLGLVLAAFIILKRRKNEPTNL